MYYWNKVYIGYCDGARFGGMTMMMMMMMTTMMMGMIGMIPHESNMWLASRSLIDLLMTVSLSAGNDSRNNKYASDM